MPRRGRALFAKAPPASMAFSGSSARAVPSATRSSCSCSAEISSSLTCSLVMINYGTVGVRLIWLAAIHAVEDADSKSPTASPL